MFNFYRIATCTPRLHVADVSYNTNQILELACRAHDGGAALAIFPELAITGATCGDLFFNSQLLDAAEKTLRDMLCYLPAQTIYLVGCPIRINSSLISAAVVIQNGLILGVVPKTYLPSMDDVISSRWFTSADDILDETMDFAGCKNIPVGNDLIFKADNALTFAAELGEDILLAQSPALTATLAGATLIANLAASTDYVGKAQRRRDCILASSRRLVAAYAFVSAGIDESTTDAVFGGHQIVAENGDLLLESPRFVRDQNIDFADVDIDRILHARIGNSLYRANVARSTVSCRTIQTAPVQQNKNTIRIFARKPFVPVEKQRLQCVCAEIFAVQTAGLAKRIEHTNAKKLVLGISGGLDSTLALLVCIDTLKQLGRPASDLITVTMPGFGTTDRTYNNACGLCRELGSELREISIKNACIEHFQNIGHDPENHNVVYENSQARERTQILLDIANQTNGIAVGTGDLSEGAMGWCTFNGDHISLYGVNASVPKTLIPAIITWYGESTTSQARAFLRDVIDTPVSPELLPADKNGEIKQKTEDIIGPYEVHDFFLYHFMTEGASAEKLLFLALNAFGQDFTEEQLRRFLNGFLRRFVTQQFKRSCCPDAPRVGAIAFSPRGALSMPSDAAFTAFALNN